MEGVSDEGIQLIDTMPRTGRQAPMGEDKRSVVPQQG
jgi:hypothetical protein